MFEMVFKLILAVALVFVGITANVVFPGRLSPCGGKLARAEGVIAFEDFSHDAGLWCAWEINVPGAVRLILNFRPMSLASDFDITMKEGRLCGQMVMVGWGDDYARSVIPEFLCGVLLHETHTIDVPAGRAFVDLIDMEPGRFKIMGLQYSAVFTKHCDVGWKEKTNSINGKRCIKLFQDEVNHEVATTTCAGHRGWIFSPCHDQSELDDVRSLIDGSVNELWSRKAYQKNSFTARKETDNCQYGWADQARDKQVDKEMCAALLTNGDNKAYTGPTAPYLRILKSCDQKAQFICEVPSTEDN